MSYAESFFMFMLFLGGMSGVLLIGSFGFWVGEAMFKITKGL